MSKSTKFSRRDFIKTTALASSGLWLSGCVGINGAFTGEKRNLSDEVLILGAGAAGLSAAYSLKKNKIPYRVFEASSRVGGRIYSLSSFSASGQSAELGAESFNENHRMTMQLCKELNLEKIEVKSDSKLESNLFYISGKMLGTQQLKTLMHPLYSQLAKNCADVFSSVVMLNSENITKIDKASYYDSMSAANYVQSLSAYADKTAIDIFLLQIRSDFGVDPAQLSALQLLFKLQHEVFTSQSKSNFKIRGGNASLTQVLYSRVSGVIPDYLIKTSHQLVEIRKWSDTYELSFKTDSGIVSYRSKQVICALPLSSLRDVDGIDNIFDTKTTDWIKNLSYSHELKSVVEYKESFLRKKTNMHPMSSGQIVSDLKSQFIFDQAWGQEGKGSLFSSQRVVYVGQNFSPIDELIQDLDKIHPGSSSLLGTSVNVINWSQRSFQKGARSFFAPGQMVKFFETNIKADQSGSTAFIFAGEHCSTQFQGTIEGALQSGLNAAEVIKNKSAGSII